MLTRRETAGQHLRRAAKILVGGAALCAVCGLPLAWKYPQAFTGEWAWLKYVGLGAVFFALDLVLQGFTDIVRRRKRRAS